MEDDDPLTLAEASKQIFRGNLSVSALRTAISRGELVAEKLGGKLFVTPAEIRAWRAKCRLERSRPDSGSDLRDMTVPRSGSSKREAAVSAQDAFRTILKAQKTH